MNHLEQIVAERLQYRGYFVITSVSSILPLIRTLQLAADAIGGSVGEYRLIPGRP